MLDAARWEGIAAEVEPHLPPLLLRVALRESVKADTAPYRRHMVVLSHLEAVTEAKRRLGLQVQVCKPPALRDYLGWLQQTRASVAARGRWGRNPPPPGLSLACIGGQCVYILMYWIVGGVYCIEMVNFIL